jgi:branched-subunit amino acid ABC-type transport system permease component
MVVNGICLGTLLLLIATGLNIIYGINRVINLAHGALYALGAFVGLTLVNNGVNFLFALVIAPIVVAVVGIAIERSVIAPIRHRDIVYSLILTYGVMVFLDGITRYFWGVQSHLMQAPDYLTGTISIAGVQYPAYRLFVLVATAAVMAGVLLLLNRTRMGIAMRAASTIPEMVSVLGVNMNVVHMGVFGLGCALAGIAGVIAGPLLSVYPMMGNEFLISSFVVLVIGGLGSLRGAAIAALLVGMVQTAGYVFITDYAMVVVYVMMAAVLTFMPRGILGEGKFE